MDLNTETTFHIKLILETKPLYLFYYANLLISDILPYI